MPTLTIDEVRFKTILTNALKGVHDRLDGMDKRLEKMDKRFDKLETLFTAEIGGLRNEVRDSHRETDRRLKVLEQANTNIS